MGIFDSILQEKAKKYGVPFGLAKGTMMAESNENPNAVSSAGAQGLMQLMPATGKDYGVTDPFDPTQNIDAGLRHLKRLHDVTGDWTEVPSAFNAGEGNWKKYKGDIPFGETKKYEPRVFDNWKKFEPETFPSSQGALNPAAPSNPDLEFDRTGKTNQQLSLSPEFASGGLDTPMAPPRRGLFGTLGQPEQKRSFGDKIKGFFTGKTTDGGVDELGIEKPDIKEQSTFGKILNYLLPMVFGVAGGAGFIPGALAGMAGSGARRGGANEAEMERYGKERTAALKAKEPSEMWKQVSEYMNGSPEQKKAYENMQRIKAESNPLGMMNYDLSQRRFDEDRRWKEEEAKRKTEKEGQDKREKESKELEVRDNLLSVRNNVVKMGDALKTLPSGKIAGRAGEFLHQNILSSPEYTEYLARESESLANLARIGGDKGVLTDQDVARVKGGMPNPRQSPEEQARALQTTLEFIDGKYADWEKRRSYVFGDSGAPGISGSPNESLPPQPQAPAQKKPKSLYKMPEAVSDEDRQAIEWARKNSKDPRAQQIIKANGL
jgi:hypothetical protein